MKTLRPYLVALGLAAAALSSCGRSYYSFQSKPSAYLGTVSTVAPAAPAPDAAPSVATMPEAQSAVVATARQLAPQPSLAARPATQPTAITPLIEVPIAASPTVAASPAPAPKLPVAQRLLLHRVLKQATRATARQQNTASVTETTATKGSLIIAVVGLIALIIGLIASSGFLITVGIIALVVGIVLYLLKKL